MTATDARRLHAPRCRQIGRTKAHSVHPRAGGGSGFETGQPLTTGQIVLKDSVPAPFTLTFSGYDNRNASGVGTIQLVGGSYIQRPTGNPSQAFPRQTVLTLTLPEPTSALGFAGGAIALLFLARRGRGGARRG
jgi:hypothetical protein